MEIQKIQLWANKFLPKPIQWNKIGRIGKCMWGEATASFNLTSLMFNIDYCFEGKILGAVTSDFEFIEVSFIRCDKTQDLRPWLINQVCFQFQFLLPTNIWISIWYLFWVITAIPGPLRLS